VQTLPDVVGEAPDTERVRRGRDEKTVFEREPFPSGHLLGKSSDVSVQARSASDMAAAVTQK
jgi:hypothetical protein